MDRTTARDRRVQQMINKGYTTLTPSERDAKLGHGFDALKKLVVYLDAEKKAYTDEERGR